MFLAEKCHPSIVLDVIQMTVIEFPCNFKNATEEDHVVLIEYRCVT